MDSAKDLYQSIQIFERNNVGAYLIVSEAYRKLHHFSLKLPARNKDLKDYIDGINRELINGDLSIEQRALKVKSLPDDAVFIEKLSAADDGTSFLRKFKQFLQRVISSIFEGIRAGVSICYIYNQKKIEHSAKNIERSIRLSNAANGIDDLDTTQTHDETEVANELEEPDEIEGPDGIKKIDEDEELKVDTENDEEVRSNQFNY